MQKNHLFLYLKTGGGHLAPAKSLANYIHNNHTDKAKVTLLDGFAGVNKWVRLIVEDGYRQSQSSAVWIFEWLYAVNKIPVAARLLTWMISLFIIPQLERYIIKKNPEHIVIFHFFLIRPVMKIIGKYGFQIPVTVVVTDPFTAHPIWFLDKRPGFIVFSNKMKDYSNHKGIPENAVKVFPFILDERFTRPLSQVLVRAMKENLGFDPDKRLVLILGGGDGIPKGKKILKSVIRQNPNANVAIVCGNNKALYNHAWRIKSKYHFDGLKIYGFVDFVYELINIADVVVTKCGASTFMEILISGKIPIITNFIWEQEKGNMEFVCKNKLGIYEKNIERLPELIDEIIHKPEVYDFYTENIRKQNLVNGTSLVSEFIMTEKSPTV
jgi:1,2-diacylglycerol 3-beta-galactosyltransferase